MIRMKLLMCALCLGLVLPATALDDDMGHHHHDANEKLGKVSFPFPAPRHRSGVRARRGTDALVRLRGGRRAIHGGREDRCGCAMAHWGIAMSLFHQIWERPEDATLKRGHDEIEPAQKIGAKTERERGYIAALGNILRRPIKRSLSEAGKPRIRTRWRKLYQKYPADLEAGAFYALSLLAAAKPERHFA